MKLPRAPKAVIFDMDGLMIDTVPAYVRAMTAASVDVGHPLSRAYFLSLVGLLGRELEARMIGDLGQAFPLAEFTSAMFTRLEPLLLAGVALKPGAAELIDGLARSGLRLAVATSMKRADALHHLAMHDLRKHFGQVIGRDDVPNGKPYPDVYLKAASAMDTAPGDCLALEDSFNGVRAAHAAGAMTVMVPDVVVPTSEIAALCVGVVADLHHVRSGLGMA